MGEYLGLVGEYLGDENLAGELGVKLAFGELGARGVALETCL